MLTLSTVAAATVRGSWTMHTRIDSWRAGQLLAGDIPIAGGTHETDRSLRVPDRVTLTVPRTDAGTSWDPTGDSAHPLAPWGQRIRVSVGVELASGGIEWICRGWYLITSADVDGDRVQVTAANLLQLIDEARLTAPLQPTGTIAAALRTLVEPALTVDVTAAPTDRAVPSGLTWDEDRLAAVCELLDAWPADAVVDTGGVLMVTARAITPGEPVWDLSTSAGGTVVTPTSGTVSRDGAATAVVARGTTADGTTVQAVAYDTSGGPLDASGPFNPLPVPELFFSPLLTSVAECVQAADTVLARRRAQAARIVTIDAVPCPALQAGDLVAVDAPDDVGTVETITMPLTPGGGPMQVGVSVDG